MKAVHVHPEYHVKSLTSDIAIIELVEPVSLSDNTIPVCLPISYEHDTLVLSFGNTGEVRLNSCISLFVDLLMINSVTNI